MSERDRRPRPDCVAEAAAAATHVSDEDCTVEQATGLCTVCGVYHGDPCPTCGGRGYHREGCAVLDDTCQSDSPGRRAWTDSDEYNGR